MANMENSENKVDGGAPELLGMSLDYDGGNTLHEAARWSRLQSVWSMISGGLLLLAILIGGPIWVYNHADGSPAGLGTVELAFMAIALFIAAALVAAVFLLRFTSQARKGILTQDQTTFNRGLKSLKIYFVIGAILSILLLLEFLIVLISQLLLL